MSYIPVQTFIAKTSQTRSDHSQTFCIPYVRKKLQTASSLDPVLWGIESWEDAFLITTIVTSLRLGLIVIYSVYPYNQHLSLFAFMQLSYIVNLRILGFLFDEKFCWNISWIGNIYIYIIGRFFYVFLFKVQSSWLWYKSTIWLMNNGKPLIFRTN